jgi:Sec-independent protein translocase protein TatA
MLDIGWSELLLLIIVAVIFLRPSDIPVALKSFGKLTRQLQDIRQQSLSWIQEKGVMNSHDTDLNITSETQKIKNYIKDINGNIQPIYDLGDLRPDLQEKIEEAFQHLAHEEAPFSSPSLSTPDTIPHESRSSS